MAEKKFSDEIEAMGVIEEALTPLDEEARQRVIVWAANRYGVTMIGRSSGAKKPAPGSSLQTEEQPAEFADLADLFAKAGPTSEADKALVVGYWFQYGEGQADFDAQAVNTQLKHLGHGVGNITSAFDSLIARKPQHVIQLKKSGTTKQARKKYRLTEEGRKAVLRLVAGTGAEE